MPRASTANIPTSALMPKAWLMIRGIRTLFLNTCNRTENPMTNSTRGESQRQGHQDGRSYGRTGPDERHCLKQPGQDGEREDVGQPDQT